MGYLEELLVTDTRRREGGIWHHSLGSMVIKFLGLVFVH